MGPTMPFGHNEDDRFTGPQTRAGKQTHRLRDLIVIGIRIDDMSARSGMRQKSSCRGGHYLNLAVCCSGC